MAAKAIETAAALALEGARRRRRDGSHLEGGASVGGIPYPGHTEFFGALARVPDARMLFVGGDFRILLATVHLPLRRVADALTSRIARADAGVRRGGAA